MAESNGSSKEILAVKVKLNLARQSYSGLLVAYFDLFRTAIVGNFALIVEGEELAGVALSDSHEKIVETIRTGATRFHVSGDMTGKLRGKLDTAVTKAYIGALVNHIRSKDIGSAENMIKRSVESVLSTDKIDATLEFELINQGQFAMLNVDEQSDRLTFSDKIQLVLPYAENQPELAEKIIRENIQDITLIRFSFLSGNEVFGSALITCSSLKMKYHSIIIAAGGERALMDLDPGMPIVDYYNALLALLAHPKADKMLMTKIDALLRRIDPGKLMEAVSNNDEGGMAALLSDPLKNLTGRGAEVQARSEAMNSLRMSLLLNPERSRKKDEISQVKKEEMPGLKVIDASLIVSPGRGKQISSLRQGDWLQVLLNPANPLAMKILKGLNLLENNKPKPIGAKVHTVKRVPKVGFVIYVQVAEGVLGKAEEEQDVRVKTGDPVVEEIEQKSGGSLMIGLIAGIIVLAVLLIILVLK